MSTITIQSPALIMTLETTSSNETVTFGTRAISDIGAGSEPSPIGPSPTSYNFIVDWGDGEQEEVTGTDPNPSHTYAIQGTYTVKFFADPDVGGSLPNLQFPTQAKTLEQWGGIQWKTMYSFFQGIPDFDYRADDAPNLSDVRNYKLMFSGAGSTEFVFSTPIGNWNFYGAQSIESVFKDFGDDFGTSVGAGEWDVSDVTNMASSFENAGTGFDIDVRFRNWDVSNVQNMNSMFKNSGGPRLESGLKDWDVSSVTNMASMFENVQGEIQNGFDKTDNFEPWDVSSVTTMANMFKDTDFQHFIRPWDVSNVEDFSGMFENSTFDVSLEDWNVISATDMTAMFNGSGLSDRDAGQTIRGWADPGFAEVSNSPSDYNSGVTLGMSTNDYSAFSSLQQQAVDDMCSDPPNWTINIQNAPADCT